MTDQRTLFESMVLTSVTQLAASYRPVFAEYKLSFQQPEIRQREQELGGSELSELELSVYANGNFIDVIECFIWKEGRPYATVDDISKFVDGSLREILEGKRSG